MGKESVEIAQQKIRQTERILRNPKAEMKESLQESLQESLLQKRGRMRRGREGGREGGKEGRMAWKHKAALPIATHLSLFRPPAASPIHHQRPPLKRQEEGSPFLSFNWIKWIIMIIKWSIIYQVNNNNSCCFCSSIRMRKWLRAPWPWNQVGFRIGGNEVAVSSEINPLPSLSISIQFHDGINSKKTFASPSLKLPLSAAGCRSLPPPSSLPPPPLRHPADVFQNNYPVPPSVAA